MLSEDGELVIHIAEDTLVYFESAVPASEDDSETKMTQMVRDVLFGRTLAQVLDGRNLTVTYAVTTRSLPPQTTPISVRVLFEEAVPLPIGASLGDSLPFNDVQSFVWYYQPVSWAFQNGIMNGVSETAFAPEAEMSRGMLVTILWRYAGSPEAGEAAFTDVESGRWYSAAVAWAAENNIVSGYSETIFGANDYVNREQMHTILYRYMNFAGLTITLDDEMRLQQFADADKISEWALEALHFMYDAGITFQQSTLDNYARPKEYAIRGEIAAAMYFFDMRAVSLQQSGLDGVQYIRTNWYAGKSGVTVINSNSEFERHFAQVNGFESRYTDDFFTQKYLLIVSTEENSGSIRHRVGRVGENGDLIIVRLLPEIGTADMAGWDIIIELDKAFAPNNFNVIWLSEDV